MKDDLREILGNAIQAERREHTLLPSGEYWEYAWEDRDEVTKEQDRQAGEIAVRTYLEIACPGFIRQIRWQNGAILSEHDFWQAFGEEPLTTRGEV